MVDAVILQEDIQEGYFFSGRRYARIKWASYGSDEKITFGPKPIVDHWPALSNAGFGRVEAAFPVHGTTTEFYFFFGARVARVQFQPGKKDTIVEGPLKITDKWKSLANTPFDTIDAALVVPDLANQVYFFRGTHYVRIDVANDKIIYGPSKLADEWPGLTQAGFDSIDAAVPVPNAKVHGEYYVFKGSQYVRLQVLASKADKLTWGPKPIADYWKSLEWA
ncbi:hypothetical protein N7455_005866 [Penicillium solitum]|uniref:uncharacterized protein n=1 Tax=Penicillium solitum TaxID=60172 RepID=UPI0032C4A778|nr:hypothetical protein N7536_000353 [Penicillium majusculum]KAJ5870925.1 hypothetical protein N7455_005866 [Penicillium solitum]